MDFEWIAIALGDVAWVTLAFTFGLLARVIGLPPLVGFLVTGFVLNLTGATSGEVLQKLADLGITLLLFTVGLKLNLKVLIRPHVWAVTGLHVLIIVALFSLLIYALLLFGLPLFVHLDFKAALLIAFALSFSSTVFVVKALEEKGEMKSLHGRIAISILVMQDLLAVIFLAASSDALPSIEALLLLLLIPMRPLLHYLLQRTGHGELLILYGLVLAIGGAELFELSGVKDDLGALAMGVLISTHPKATEMSKSIQGLKDLFLVGFFLSIGMSSQLTLDALLIGALLVPLIFIKSALFFGLMTRFKLRARTSLLTTLNLTNYSEFGLIVIAVCYTNGWLEAEWLAVMAITLSLSFVVAAPLNNLDNRIYSHYRKFWMRFQRGDRLPDDGLLNTGGATIAIFGMGRIGSGAYKKMHEIYGETVVGIDFDAEKIKAHRAAGRKVLHGDPSDADFWDKMEHNHTIELVMLALPNQDANLDALEQLREIDFSGRIAVIARYPDEAGELRRLGATAVFNIYTEAGAGFAEHVSELPSPCSPG